MFLLGTKLSSCWKKSLSSGKLRTRFPNILYVCRNVEILGFWSYDNGIHVDKKNNYSLLVILVKTVVRVRSFAL